MDITFGVWVNANQSTIQEIFAKIGDQIIAWCLPSRGGRSTDKKKTKNEIRVTARVRYSIVAGVHIEEGSHEASGKRTYFRRSPGQSWLLE